MNTQTEEKWRTIPDYPRYVVSNKGRVATKEGTLKTVNEGRVKLYNGEGFSTRLVVRKLIEKLWAKN